MLRQLTQLTRQSHLARVPLYNLRIATQLFNSRYYSSDVEKLKNETDANDLDQSAEITGVMDYLKLTEVLMFFDNVYPRWLAKLAYSRYFSFFKPLRLLFTDDKLKNRVCKLIESDDKPLPPGTQYAEFVPFQRDGGAFVKFLVPPTSSVKELTQTIEGNIQAIKADYESTLAAYFKSFPRAYRVKGTPWIEDLSRFPSAKLKVKFEGEPLTEEELYLLFRRYGLIVDIVPYSSTTPYATVIFKSTDACIRAKNCTTGMILNEGKTSLHLQYIPRERVNHITDFIVNHQRIAIPVILALLATIAVFIFEPIREQFITFKIKHYYSWDSHKDHWLVRALYTPYRYVISSINDGRHFLDSSLGLIRGTNKDAQDLESLETNMFWTERTEKANQVRLWVSENANTFIIVKGPKGSGKREFVVDHALKVNDVFLRRLLELDCDALIKARSDNLFLKSTASQLGYFPLFTWTNTISSFVDLGLQGLTGQKSGFSESKETQFKNMLLLTQVAIRKVALADYEAFKCEHQRLQEKKSGQNGGAVDAQVMELKEEDYLQLNPEVKPVIVINNFLRKAEGGNDFIYKVLAEWAGQLIQNNTAHVIFITLDSGSTLHLTSALPNQVFKSISLADASHVSAKQYVTSQLKGEEELKNLEVCLEPIGGRMLDLQAFVRRVKSGESANDALKEMVHQAAEQITTFFLNITERPEAGSDVTWTTAQIWALMRLLAKQDAVEFIELVKSPLFVSSYETVSTLSVLEKNDLISLQREKGIIKSITTGRPLYKAAFEELVGDQKIFQVYESYFYKTLISMENAKISKLEDEVSKIGGISDYKLMKDRLEYVAKKITASTEKIEGYEQQVKEIESMQAQPKKVGLFGF